MSIARVLRRVSAVRPLQARALCTWRDRDLARERDYFNREDRKLLQDLLAKMEKANDPECEKQGKALDGIFDKFGLSLTPALKDDLKQWKRDWTQEE
mmetsp:Transcript_22226/g.24701  ORF Transcript_22226/g.24701 Transcript_22226/m.24701 type:complete len:97 (-) Transcript_22226:27-317(-)|eukprot:CAMPEP_0205822476 /NCGR_PEP_ID=MMETSP0206-20130828/12624_1 /ASSEMBLY_ACC=CAM_ASM_000279 /TAXON_ID=36767 /ORGANISM="Euplotes focardii, Strain TN1" /LENGTH=96 /DNA_ID=CAMNT_0053118771 /DNA_START=27 /DNA_END=317 /DNA_ORIENTATION=+